jgi:uncharacterized alkaline shock family protein YloU
MRFIFRLSIFLAGLILIFMGWVVILIGFDAVDISEITSALGWRLFIIGGGFWLSASLLLFFDKRYFYQKKQIEIKTEYGSVNITKDAISDLIREMDIDGVSSIHPNVSIKDGRLIVDVRLKVFAGNKIKEVTDSINKRLIWALEEILSVQDYRKRVVIEQITKRRGLS